MDTYFRSAWPLLALSLLLFGTSCATYRTGPEHHGPPVNAAKMLGIVEIDDQGRYWDKAQEAEVLSNVRRLAQRGGATIVVFIHGWHHNASATDSNLSEFTKALSDLRTELDQHVYKMARKAFFGHEDGDVFGVYIGWRGRSLPSYADYLTFWDRKAAAERIGQGDVVELLSRLDQTCRLANGNGRYTGLVTVAHSFGAQVASTAISSILRQRVATGRDDSATFVEPVAGFGDLVVLVNPAAEAAVLNTLSEATRGAKFASSQAPVMLVVSSENDGATGSWFPFGRRLAVRRQVYRGNEYAQNTRALGWYLPQITHCLALEAGRGCFGSAGRNVSYRGPQFTAAQAKSGMPSEAYAGVWVPRDAVAPEEIQLGGDIGMAGVRMYRVAPDVDVNQPVVFAKATKDVVNGHNGVFDRAFTEFLIRYATGAELKRFLIQARPMMSPAQ
jgi:hypothetical protein